LKKDTETKQMGLIIQPGAVGDVILTIPLIRLLRKRMGLNQVDVMGRQERMDLLAGRCEVGQIISLERSGLHKMFEESNKFELPEGDELFELFRPYDVIATFLKDKQGYFEQNLIFTAWCTHSAEVMTLELRPKGDWPGHAAGFFMQQFCELKLRESGIVRRMTTAQERVQLSLLEEFMAPPLIKVQQRDINRGREILIREGIKEANKAVVVHPGSGGKHKCWFIKDFCDLAGYLTEEGMEVMFLLGPAEQERWGEKERSELGEAGLVLEGLNLEEVAGLLSCCAGFVGNDSGISHLAGALDLPTVAIFGESDIRHWRPLGQKVNICQSKEEASGVWPKVEEVAEAVIRFFEG